MSSAAKVGVFMLIILAILGYFILKIEDLRVGKGAGTKTVGVTFDSVAGLDKKSTVRVAGVRVGQVEDIKLGPDGRAHVKLTVDKDVQLHANASAHVANMGLLGEKYIELDPGTPTQPVIESDNIQLRGGTPATIDDVTNQVSAIATDVKAITASLRSVMAGPSGQQRLEDIIENVRQITAETRELIAANRTNVDATLQNARIVSEQLKNEIPRLATSIDKVANEIGGTVGENRQDVHAIVENLHKLSDDLRVTTANLNNITGQVKSGEGTVGKLIYSDEAHDKLTTALSSVESGVNELKNTLGRANRIQMDLGIKSDYYAGLKQDETTKLISGNSRSAVNIRLNPNPENNRFYNIELADDPMGSRRDKVITDVVIDPVTGARTERITEETRYERKFLVSAQAGWVLDSLAVRVGLFDSAGGVGADYTWNDRIRFTGEAFDFGKKRDDNPHVRAFGQYIVRKETSHTPQLFVSAGVDNPLNKTAVTFGGGIRWRDDDLKYLLGSASSAIGK